MAEKEKPWQDDAVAKEAREIMAKSREDQLLKETYTATIHTPTNVQSNTELEK